LRAEGFYRVRIDGQPGVAYCYHMTSEIEPYETWCTLHLFDRYHGKPHPASSTITPRSDPLGASRLEVLGRIRM
jgi:hypothetical protein